MCGGATDLSVLALMKTKEASIFISTCCHHRCSLDTYCNLKFLKKELELNDQEIEILFMLSSWAVNNLYRTKKKKEEKIEEENQPFFKVLDLDIGRCLFIKETLIRDCFMKQFCDISITPENFVIVSP